VKIIEFFIMSGKNKLKLHDYLSWLFKKYQELISQIKDIPAYEIKDINFVNGTHTLLIQINGTGKIVPYLPQEIANDDAFLEKFSTKDIRTILYLNFEELKKPKYTIVGHKFSEKTKVILCLRDRESGEIKNLTAKEISINKDVLKQCSPEDAHRVGYLHATDEMKEEEFPDY